MFRFNVRKMLGMVMAGLMLAFAATVHAGGIQLVNEASETMALFKKTDPGIATFFERAPGYVIFPGIGKAGIGVGGAHGTGVLYQHGEPVGKATVNQVSVGAQLGAQEYAEVIFFATPQAMTNFMKGSMKLAGEVSAVALKSGASANAKYQDGVVVFTATKGGLMLEAAVAGQKFSYEPFMVIKK